MLEYSSEEVKNILNEAARMKQSTLRVSNLLHGKFLVMIFQKPSTRTRISFDVAMKQLGGEVISLNWSEMQLGKGETISDTARIIERYADGIVARVFSHKDLEELAEYARVPVINALSDLHHPCQALADMLTILEKKGKWEGLKLAWVGDGNNVCHSLMIACAKLGLNMSVASPANYSPNADIVKIVKKIAEKSNVNIEVFEDPIKAVKGADVIYSDIFVSMGMEAEREERLKIFLPRYRVTSDLFKHANDNCIFMHCLPARRGEEVTEEVIDGARSVVWDQAENRLHAQKALLAHLL
jgi:ornithine carbamoyltransferase